MKLLDELFDLGDAALEDQIAVVGLAFGDLAGNGGQHQILNFFTQVGTSSCTVLDFYYDESQI